VRAFVATEMPPIEGSLPVGLRPEDHITLHFFEELPIDQVPVVVDAISEAVTGVGPFDMEVRGVGAFPTVQRPRVLWAGVGEGSAALVSVVDRLRGALFSRGFPGEHRPFVPHLTLARMRTPGDARWAKQFLSEPDHVARVWARTRVSEIVLKQSELLTTGPRHTVLERVTLGPPPTTTSAR
jgi:2'-5' RNA ligase